MDQSDAPADHQQPAGCGDCDKRSGYISDDADGTDYHE
jgi:hypothetical protein